jgi:hypothetical protein
MGALFLCVELQDKTISGIIEIEVSSLHSLSFSLTKNPLVEAAALHALLLRDLSYQSFSVSAKSHQAGMARLMHGR